MDQALQSACAQFIRNRDTVKKAFPGTFNTVYPSSAALLLSRGKTVDVDRLRACKKTVKANAGVFNNFRSTLYAPTCCLLAAAPDPERKMALAVEYCKTLREFFPGCAQLSLTALILTDFAASDEVRAKAERGKEIYRLLKEKHRLLTDRTDSIFAVLLGFSARSDTEIIDDVEQCYALLKPLAGNNYIQTVAFILATSEKQAEEKCAKFRALYDALRAKGLKYRKDYALSVLAALSLADADVDTLVREAAEVDAFLATQKGYKGIFRADRRTRLMDAVILSSSYRLPAAETDAAALSAMLAIIAMQMAVMAAVISSSASSAAASSSSGR